MYICYICKRRIKQQLADLQEEKEFCDAEYSEKINAQIEENSKVQAELEKIKLQDGKNLSDDTKRLEAEIADLQAAIEGAQAAQAATLSDLTNVKAELESTKEARDQYELEKDEHSIKVLIEKFKKLSIHPFHDSPNHSQEKSRKSRPKRSFCLEPSKLII